MKKSGQGNSLPSTPPINKSDWGTLTVNALRNLPGDANEGDIVYVLINEAMPGYTKIGITNDLRRRLKQLSGTAVPVPFEVFAAKRVRNARDVEAKLHATFSKDRIDSGAGREFFLITPEQAAAALSLVEGEEIKSDETGVTTEKEKIALEEVKSRRPPFLFSYARVPIGSVLAFSLDENITATVHDDKKVVFQNEIMSLSDAAMRVLESKGLFWKAVSGPGIWMYEGDTLHERRKRFELEA